MGRGSKMSDAMLKPRLFRALLVVRQLGWGSCVLILLWSTAILAWVWGLPSLHEHLRIQQREVEHLKQLIEAREKAVQLPQRSIDEERLQAFYDALGETRFAEQQIKSLFAIAAKNGLNLSHADYKFADDRNGRFQTYQVVVPVKGPYKAIRQFVEEILIAIPFASLDELTFKRDAIANNMLEARLRVTLYLNRSLPAVGIQNTNAVLENHQ